MAKVFIQIMPIWGVLILTRCTLQAVLCQTSEAVEDRLHAIEERLSCVERAITQEDTGSSHPRDCDGVYEQGDRTDGVYTIQPKGSAPFQVVCQFDSGGKWTMLQRRVDGSTDFKRSWFSFQDGFGHLDYSSNFWLGLESIYHLTHQRQYTLRIDLMKWDEASIYAEYEVFYIENALAKYAIHYYGYSGNAGDELGEHHQGAKFSTMDSDNDNFEKTSCASSHGPFWLNYCDTVNLNGEYGSGTGDEGIEWGINKSFKETSMKIKPTYGDNLRW